MNIFTQHRLFNNEVPEQRFHASNSFVRSSNLKVFIFLCLILQTVSNPYMTVNEKHACNPITEQHLYFYYAIFVQFSLYDMWTHDIAWVLSTVNRFQTSRPFLKRNVPSLLQQILQKMHTYVGTRGHTHTHTNNTGVNRCHYNKFI